MADILKEQLSQMETTCGNLLCELQKIWDEVGETDEERDKLLLELEHECLEVYRRKVDKANRSIAQLRQAIADAEAELATICSTMGEPPVHCRERNVESLKAELSSIVPQVEDMQKRKSERRNNFIEVIDQIQHISHEIMSDEHIGMNVVLEESDLSNRRLEEFHKLLESLLKEKGRRLKLVQDNLIVLNSLCLVLGFDYRQVVSEVHPSLDGSQELRSVSDATIEKLSTLIKNLLEHKIERMQKLQDLATTLLELWNFMDTPVEEQQAFQNVTCNVAASEHEITEPNMLSEDFMKHVEAEVLRLDELKSTKMKDLVLKKKTELEELRRHIHIVAESNNEIEFVMQAIETGAVDPSLVLEEIEFQVSVVKEEALSRKEILEKVEKWLVACNEESWLDEYNRDENRYSAGRGNHLTLKRAEQARVLVNKIPAIVEALATKVIEWENERAMTFTYDGVRLMSMLEEYNILRLEKEEERKRQRDQKKLQGQLIAEQEMLYGSKPSPTKHQSSKKQPRMSTGGPNRTMSLGGAATLKSLHPTKPTPPQSSTKKRNEASAFFSTYSRGSDVGSLPSAKKHLHANAAVDAREAKTPRKPFAPLLLHPMSNTNMPSTPSPAKPGSMVLAPDETKTPMRPAPSVMSTMVPMTASKPMQVATTPAPPLPSAAVGRYFAHEGSAAKAVVAKDEEDVEYSFEERRLAFLMTR